MRCRRVDEPKNGPDSLLFRGEQCVISGAALVCFDRFPSFGHALSINAPVKEVGCAPLDIVSGWSHLMIRAICRLSSLCKLSRISPEDTIVISPLTKQHLLDEKASRFSEDGLRPTGKEARIREPRQPPLPQFRAGRPPP